MNKGLYEATCAPALSLMKLYPDSENAGKRSVDGDHRTLRPSVRLLSGKWRNAVSVPCGAVGYMLCSMLEIEDENPSTMPAVPPARRYLAQRQSAA